MRALHAGYAFLAALLVSSVALAAPRSHKPRATRATTIHTSTHAESVGSPNEGHLVGGVELRASKCLRLIGEDRFGVGELVSLVERSCKRVEGRHPGERLTVGDLSKKGGGDVPGHHSHESGRDVDLGFYLVDARGRQVFARRFATIDPDGRAKGMGGVRFDDAANWDLVEALVTDPNARVLQIFVAKPLRARLLTEAQKRGASPSVRDRAASLMLQPTHGLPHDNHFHVRIACPKNSPACVDYATRDRTKKHPVRSPRKPARATSGRRAR